MSISTTDTKVTYVGNNSTSTAYPITYKYLDTSHISVYSGGVDITGTCTFAGDGTSGTGEFTTNPAIPATSNVVAVLDIPLDQPVVLAETSPIPAKTIEVSGFDRLNMQIRRLWRKMQSALIVSGDEGAGSTGTADTLLGFDSSGELQEIPKSDFAGTVQGTGATTYNLQSALSNDAVNANPRAEYSVDLQTQRSLATQVASGLLSVIVGGQNNTASKAKAAVIGGTTNIANGVNSFIGGGSTNQTQNTGAAIIGGIRNVASGGNSIVLGGSDNIASGAGTLCAGDEVTASHTGARVFADSSDTAFASIANEEFAIQGSALRLVDGNEGAGKVLTCDANGSGNWADLPAGGTVQGTDGIHDIRAANEGTVAGNARGENSVDLQTKRTAADQVASGSGAVLLGGLYNSATGIRSTVISGTGNASSGNNAVVSGGYGNSATGGQSGVYSGTDNNASGERSIVAGGQNGAATHSGSKVFPDSTFTAFSSIANDEFAIQGSALRLVDGNEGAGKVLTCDANGSGNWADLPAGGSGGTVQGTDGLYDLRPADEGVAVAGNARGERSVDLQTNRTLATQVASGLGAVLIGGDQNTASNTNSAVVGGSGNDNSGANTTIVGGQNNSASSFRGIILGGQNNVASAGEVLVAGEAGTASHAGARVFADGTTTAFGSIAAHEFAVQASALRLADGNEGAGKVLTCDANGSGNWTAVEKEIGIACSDETTDLTTGTAKATFRMPFAMNITEVRASVTTAPTGANIIVDINDGGTSIMTTTKLSIDAGEKTSTTAATAPVLTDTALADDAEITVDIDQIGSTVAGTGLKVWIIGTKA